jgi:hypothetical protein
LLVPEATQHLFAVDTGHLDVEEHGIRGAPRGELKPTLSRTRLGDLDPGFGQDGPNGPAHVLVVVDHQNRPSRIDQFGPLPGMDF